MDLVALPHVGSSGPGLEPVSPALAGGFLTTAPPGKSLKLDVFSNLIISILFSDGLKEGSLFSNHLGMGFYRA